MRYLKNCYTCSEEWEHILRCTRIHILMCTIFSLRELKIDKIDKILNENIIIISSKFNRRNTSLLTIIYSKLEIDG